MGMETAKQKDMDSWHKLGRQILFSSIGKLLLMLVLPNSRQHMNHNMTSSFGEHCSYNHKVCVLHKHNNFYSHLLSIFGNILTDIQATNHVWIVCKFEYWIHS